MTSLECLSPSDCFLEAMKFTARQEGGYVNHPTDPGGPTNRGVTQETYDAWREANDLPTQAVTEIEEDEVKSVYYDRYWVSGSCDLLTDLAGGCRLAVAHFDACIHSGPKQAVRFLQRALRVADDGIVGPVTTSSLGRTPPRQVLHSTICERADYMLHLVSTKPTTYLPFLRNWIYRIRRLRTRVGIFD